MRRGVLVAAVAGLTACGGGGGRAGDYDPVTHVAYVGSLPDGAVGLSHWDSHGSRIELVPVVDRATQVLILEHELWHVLTRDGDHPNDPPCVSTGGVYPATEPCPEELAQVLEAGRVVRIDFPEDETVAQDAAFFWNFAAGRYVVLVGLR